jgi:transcriptional regulator GlxA family with amidase domain
VRIAIVTFAGFNEIDSFVALNILNRVQAPGWKAELVCPTETVDSANGVRIVGQRPLELAAEADAVLFGSGRYTARIVEDPATMDRLKLDPRRQLIGSQCSGALALAKLGLLRELPVCTDLRTRPLVEAAGVRVLDRSFFASGNIGSAGGCLAAPYLSAWVLLRLLGRAAAESALAYVAPAGEHREYVAGVLAAVEPFVTGERAA